MPAVWAGIDSGKRTHHCVAIDSAGQVLSQRVANDEAALLKLIPSVLGAADSDEVVWVTDLNRGGAALVITLRAGHREASAAPYRAGIVRMRCHEPTIKYVARRTAEGPSKRDSSAASSATCPARSTRL